MKIDRKKMKDIKAKAIFAGIFLGSVALAYVTGTFFPNPYVKGKMEEKMETAIVKHAIDLGLNEPAFEYNDPESFVQSVYKCVDYLNYTTKKKQRIPSGLIIAMAGVESGWGTSRFAIDGNNLFGIRTWDPDVAQLKPLDLPNAKFGVKVYTSKCKSVKDAIRILNNHPAYEDFRTERASQQSLFNSGWDYSKLTPTLAPWSTNEKYGAIILEAINARQIP